MTADEESQRVVEVLRKNQRLVPNLDPIDMTAFSLRGGSLGDVASPASMKVAFSAWVENLRTNRVYRPGRSPVVPDVWCFKWDETDLISVAGYNHEFRNYPGIYVFLRDEGAPRPYEPIYIGMAGGATGSSSSQSISERLFQRYIPHNRDHPYRPPKQLQIVARYGNEIRNSDPAWLAHRRELKAQGTSNIRLGDAEFFAMSTVEGPYLTFHPLPLEQREEVESHKSRIQNVESALIRAANDLAYELCNKQGFVNWELVR